ncbi:MAG: tetratricopeptide repeat protein [Candidatus Rokubacteria bacterium]|nr:tetratricopeptide repeat protein [Candidatus Rokubacteria bacterium]
MTARRLLAVLLLALLAAAALPRALEAQTTEADFYVAQAALDIDDKRYESALENLRRALALEPDHVEALYYTGVVHMAQRRPDEAIRFLERARARSPRDPAIALQLGYVFFAQERYDRAQPLLEEVFRAQPTQDGLGYYVGFMRYRNKDYQGALQAFRAGRSADPEIQGLAKLYSGLALAVLGLPAQASAELNEALRLAPGSAITGPAERLRDTVVASRQRERRFTAELRTGFFYDTNVPVLPNTDFNDPIIVPLRSARHDSFGELYGLRLDYTWLRTDQFEATAGYSFFGTNYNELTSFNLTDHLVSVAGNYKRALGTMPTQAGLQYSFDVIFLDQKEFLRRHTATATEAIVENDRNLTQFFLRFQNKNFVERNPRPARQEIRDADNYMAGFVHLFRFAQDKHFIKLGYQFDWDHAVGQNYEYNGSRFSAGGQYTLPWYAIRLKYDLDIHLRDYPGNNTLLPTYKAPFSPTRLPDTGPIHRFDREMLNVFRAELPLPLGLTLAAEVQMDDNASNIAVFDYKRTVNSLTLTWTY